MAYGEYKDSGRSCGKCLYQLLNIGIFLRIVEEVIFESAGSISYQNKPFATIKWNEIDTPVFIFSDLHPSYKTLKQPDIWDLYVENKETGKYDLDCSYTLYPKGDKEYFQKLTAKGLKYYSDKLNVEKRAESSIEEKANRLKLALT